MTEQSDYRMYLESEFGHIRKELSEIKEQTTRTNSRVGHAEDDIVNLKLADVNHVINCPAMPEIKAMHNDLEGYRFIKQNPKLIIFLISILAAGSVMGYLKLAQTQERTNEIVNTLNTPVTDSRGRTYLMPAGVLVDSINKQNKK
jgi:hypothetical protein